MYIIQMHVHLNNDIRVWQYQPVDSRASGKQHHHTGPVVLMDSDTGKKEGGGAGHTLQV